MPTQTKKAIITLTVAEFIKSVFVDPSRNIRATYDTNAFAEQIFVDGEIWEPIEIYRTEKEEETNLTYTLGPDGNRRAAALTLLSQQGRADDIKPVPCLLLPSKPDEMGYLIRQLRSGNVDGKLALDAVEEGRGYVKMKALDPALTNEIIGQRVGRSAQYVMGRCHLGEAPKELHVLLPDLGDKLTESLARVYHTNTGQLTEDNLKFLCSQLKPKPDQELNAEAKELARVITGARGKDEKTAAVKRVAKAAPKKGKLLGASPQGQGPDSRTKTVDSLSKTAKQTLAAAWNAYESVISELPADAPILKAFADAKVRTLKGKESVIRSLCEKTPEAKLLTLYAGIPAILQSHGIEEKHPLQAARAVAQTLAKDGAE